jgi:hypothetical protein
MRGWSTRDRIAVAAALAAPFALCVILLPFRDGLLNTHVALLLVLVVTAVAANGNRLAGVLAALGAGLWFDFFFTEPYQRLVITDPDDVETAVLLLLVGVGVTEVAVWGRRQQARASRDAGYLAGIQAATELGATGGSAELISAVARQLTQTFGLRDCRFQHGVAGLGNPARLRRDGVIVWHGNVLDVEANGLPVDTEIELLVESHGLLRGRYLMTASPNTNATRSQCLVAVTLADQVGAALP